MDGIKISACIYFDDIFLTFFDIDILDIIILETDMIFTGCTLDRGIKYSYHYLYPFLVLPFGPVSEYLEQIIVAVQFFFCRASLHLVSLVSRS